MCPTNGVSPLDSMRTLEHYLNDMVRSSGGGGGGGAGGDHGKSADGAAGDEPATGKTPLGDISRWENVRSEAS